MFFNPDEDDDGFIPTKSSNLANLFGGDKSVDTRQTSLMYTAPKQPKSQSIVPNTASEAKSVSKPQSSVVHATVVNAYKFEKNQHLHQGKLGVAIIANHETHSHMLILYRGKQQTVTKALISLKFTFTVQNNNYASFYDDQRMSWSINFESEQNAIDFAKQVAIAKLNSSNQPLDFLLTQDLLLSHGSSLEVGEVAHIKFTAWIFSDYTFGQVFDSNVSSDNYLKVKLGDGKIMKGLHDGIVGTKKGGQRLIVIPPSLGYGKEGLDSKVPPNSTLLYHIEIKQQKDSSNPSYTPSKLPESDIQKDVAPIVSTQSEPDGNTTKEDSSVKARGASISEQLQHSSPKRDKAKIISRMAKVGQPMLPFQGAIPAQSVSSDSETEDEPRSRGSPSPEIIPKPLPRMHPHLKGSSSPLNREIVDSSPVGNVLPFQAGIVSGRSLSVFHTPSTTLSYPIPSQTSYTMLPGQPFINSPVGTDAHVPVLLSEVRAQNTELRMHVGQVAEKMDRVLGKLEQTASIYPTMEAGMLAQNIQRIIVENENLKGDVKEKTQKIETLTEKITELLQRNQKFLEQSNSMLEQRSDYLQTSTVQTQARLASLENEKAQLLAKLQENEKVTANREELLSINESLQKSLEFTKTNLKNVEEKLLEEQERNRQMVKNIEDLQNANKLLKSESSSSSYEIEQEKNAWETKCKQLEESFANLQLQLDEAKRNIPLESKKVAQPNLIEEIKKIMNATYRRLQKQFNVEESYTGESIKETLAVTIRSVTLELLDHFGGSETPPQKRPEVLPRSEPNVNLTSSQLEGQNVEISQEASTDKIIDETSCETQQLLNKESEKISDEGDNSPKQLENSCVSKESVTPSQSNDDDDDSGIWKPQPPPLFDDGDACSETEDDWLA